MAYGTRFLEISLWNAPPIIYFTSARDRWSRGVTHTPQADVAAILFTVNRSFSRRSHASCLVRAARPSSPHLIVRAKVLACLARVLRRIAPMLRKLEGLDAQRLMGGRALPDAPRKR